MTDGGSAIEWARSLLSLQSNESFEDCLSQVSSMYESSCATPESTPSNISMIPFFSGERGTGFRAGAKACISGITRETTPAHIMYACLESVVLRLGCILKLINDVLPKGEDSRNATIVASGNALTRNKLWQQMLADCSSMDVVIDSDSESEGTSRGLAMLIANSVQRRESGLKVGTYNIREPLDIKHTTKANAGAQDHWKAAILTQETLIDAVSSTWSS